MTTDAGRDALWASWFALWDGDPDEYYQWLAWLLAERGPA